MSLFKKLGLTGLALSGALSFGGCVSQADDLYRRGAIDRQNYEIMKSQERRQKGGFLLALGGTLTGMRGAQIGDVRAIVGGQGLSNLGSSIAGSSNTNVYVNNDGNRNNSNNSGLDSRGAGPTWEVFTAAGAEDCNPKDNSINIHDEKEIWEKGKTRFVVGEDFLYGAGIRNAQGRTLRHYGQETPDGEIKLMSEIQVPKRGYFFHYMGILTQPGKFHSYLTLDGVRIGDFRIQVFEDPDRKK
ncbi:MAG: hypothetical protein AABW89_05385 [Nanoarchaeota archaeon]